jgi:dihydrofolate synthase/folylpolyglutamate synthase
MHIVFGMVDDKDVDGVLELLPKQARFYFTKADSHRAINEQKLQALARTHGIEGIAYPTVVQAYQAALAQAAPDDLVFVGGSSYVVGDFLKSCN